MNTYNLKSNYPDFVFFYHPFDAAQRQMGYAKRDQVSLLTLMVGNLDEKSLALAAILTAT